MAGRTVVITGATSGLGREAAGSFARMGARLVLVGRDRARLERTRNELVAEGGGAVETVVADMSSLASVRAAADEILDSGAADRRPHRQRRRDVSDRARRPSTASR